MEFPITVMLIGGEGYDTPLKYAFACVNILW